MYNIIYFFFCWHCVVSRFWLLKITALMNIPISIFEKNIYVNYLRKYLGARLLDNRADAFLSVLGIAKQFSKAAIIFYIPTSMHPWWNLVLSVFLILAILMGIWASLVAQRLKRLPPMRETRVRSLGWEDPLEKEMATHSRILAWRIPWTKEPGGLQSTGSQRVGHDWVTLLMGI